MVRISTKDYIKAYGRQEYNKLTKDKITKLFLSREVKDGYTTWFVYGELPDKTKKIVKKIRSHIVLSKLLGNPNFEYEYNVLKNMENVYE